MPAFLGSWCPQCGSNVSVDEDGCCNACGCWAVGQGSDEAHATIADLRAEVETLKMLLPPVGSITFPPGCQQYEEAKALFERRILEGC